MTEQSCFNCVNSVDFAPNINSATCMDLCRRGSCQTLKWGDGDAYDMVNKGRAIDAEVSAGIEGKQAKKDCGNCANCADTPCPKAHNGMLVSVTDPSEIVYKPGKVFRTDEKDCPTELEVQFDEDYDNFEDGMMPKTTMPLFCKPERLTATKLKEHNDNHPLTASKDDDGTLRSFDTGATRDTADGKLDFDGFLSHPVLMQYAKFMNMNRLQSDGKLREADNWQKGIPMDVYRKSLWRHFMEAWDYMRELEFCDRELDIEGVSALCGMMFNTMGWMHEWLKTNSQVDFDGEEPTVEMSERKADLEN